MVLFSSLTAGGTTGGVGAETNDLVEFTVSSGVQLLNILFKLCCIQQNRSQPNKFNIFSLADDTPNTFVIRVPLQ